MNEYINKEAVMSKCDDIWNNADETTQTGVDTINTIDEITDFIESLPTAGVQPVKRGYWKDIMMSEATGWDLSLTGGKDAVCETVCSVCGGGCAFDCDGEALLSQYCPDCGARMDGDKE